jgi:hypothetical protein
MALELELEFTDYGTCANLYMIDQTGTYNAISNPTGYGTPNPSTTEVTDFTLTLVYNSLNNTEAEFVFEVTTGTITAATLSFASGAPTDILADLQSTSFPFTELNPFNFMRDYGTTLPTLEDGIYTLEYEISGSDSGDPFTYTATKTLPITCNTAACIKNIYLTAGINDEILNRAYQAQKWLDIAVYNTEEGNYANAVTALNRAAEICDEDINDCGCG